MVFHTKSKKGSVQQKNRYMQIYNTDLFYLYHCRYVNSHSFSIIIADMSILTVFPLSLQICQFSQFLRRKKSIEKRRSESGSLRSKKQFCLPKAEKEQTQPQI